MRQIGGEQSLWGVPPAWGEQHAHKEKKLWHSTTIQDTQYTIHRIHDTQYTGYTLQLDTMLYRGEENYSS